MSRRNWFRPANSKIKIRWRGQVSEIPQRESQWVVPDRFNQPLSLPRSRISRPWRESSSTIRWLSKKKRKSRPVSRICRSSRCAPQYTPRTIRSSIVGGPRPRKECTKPTQDVTSRRWFRAGLSHLARLRLSRTSSRTLMQTQRVHQGPQDRHTFQTNHLDLRLNPPVKAANPPPKPNYQKHTSLSIA